MAITGIGVDLVDIARFEQQLGKTPGLTERLFSPAELSGDSALKPATLAGKFAAKEAFIKAIGSGAGMNWQDVRVIKDASGKPHFELSGETANIVSAAGVSRLHLSIAHDGGMAIAYVIAEELELSNDQPAGGAHA